MSCTAPSISLHFNGCSDRLKSLREVNKCLLDLGISIQISELEANNNHWFLKMLPVGKLTVYWLGTAPAIWLRDMEEIKYRYDILCPHGNMLVMENVNRIVARNEKVLMVIEPEGILFDRFLPKIGEWHGK